MAGFPKSSRLILKQDFQALFAKARKISCESLLVLYGPNQLNHARLGIIIKKQKVKLAVQRNRYRRWIRESFRKQDNLKGLDIIVIIRSVSDKMNFTKELASVWQKLSSNS